MNLFGVGAGPVYASKYQVVEERSFNEEEKNAVKGNTIVDSEYGLSVCFHLVRGGNMYYPLSKNSNKKVGETIDMNTAKMITLKKEGDPKPIYRVEE